LSLSSVAEAESEPWGRARRRSFGRGQGGVRALGSGEAEFRRLPGLSPSPSPGVGRSGGRSAEARAESEPWGRARRSFAVFRVLARVRALGSGGAEFAVAPLARPDCLPDSLCRVAPQSEWRRRRCPSVRLVSGAVE
jgi:hypothetical protein